MWPGLCWLLQVLEWDSSKKRCHQGDEWLPWFLLVERRRGTRIQKDYHVVSRLNAHSNKLSLSLSPPKKKYLNTCAMHKTRLRPPPDNENLPLTAQTLSKCRWVDDITIINIQPISCRQKVYCCKAASQPFTTFPCDTLISNLVVRCLENSPEIPPQPSGRNLGFCPNLIYIDARVGSISTYSTAF